MKVILFSIPEYCNLGKSKIILLAMLYAVYKNHYFNINIRDIEEEETFYPQGSSGWSNNQTDTRWISKRK